MSAFLEELRALLGGTFRIDRELGGGGMSRVFLAEEIALGRLVVLKVLPPELASVLSAERFEREVRVAARLQHPHIVPLHAAGRAGDALYYTMPLVEGESLRSRFDQQGELPISEAVRLLREIADALAYAHREGVVHRDIKPDNILLSHRHAMLTDFGIARAVSAAGGGATLTQTGVVVGTPAYMAPEQATGDAQFDHRADLYALGVVAYEMLAGIPPFRAATLQALVVAHLVQDPAPLLQARPSIPPDLAAIVHRCLEKRAADRFQSAAELVEALDRVVTSAERPAAPPVVTPAAAPPSAEVMSRRSALKSGAALGLVGAGLIAGGGLGYLFARRGGLAESASYHRLTFRRGLIRSARFGPDFRTIYYGALWDGDDCRIYAVRPESPESSPLPLPPAMPLTASSTGELALALGRHDRGIMPYGTLARVPLAGDAPREMQEQVRYADWSPDGRALAIVRRVGDHDQLEFPIGNVLAEPATPGGGFSFARVSPRGDAVAAFELDDVESLNGRVVIFDRAGTRRAVSAGYVNVFGLAWNDDEVWFTAADKLPLFRDAVYAMRPSGAVRIVTRVAGNTSLHDIAPDGRLLIARTDDRTGLTVRAPGDAGERDLAWLDATQVADISADGRQILFTEMGVGGGTRRSAYLRGTDGSPAVRLGDGAALALSPDGRRAIVRASADDAYLDVIPTGAGEATRIERAGLRLFSARWLADGRRVVVRGQAGSGRPRLFVMEVDGSSVRAITPEDLAFRATAWRESPVGAWVALSTAQGVELFPVTGGVAQRVPGSSAQWLVVGWIREGLLVADAPAAGGTVYVVDVATGRRRAWAQLEPRDPAGIMNMDLTSLVVTPDGRWYAYSWHRAVSDLFLVEGWR